MKKRIYASVLAIVVGSLICISAIFASAADADQSGIEPGVVATSINLAENITLNTLLYPGDTGATAARAYLPGSSEYLEYALDSASEVEYAGCVCYLVSFEIPVKDVNHSIKIEFYTNSADSPVITDEISVEDYLQSYMSHEYASDSLCDVCGKGKGLCYTSHEFVEGVDEAGAATGLCATCGKASGECYVTHDFSDLTGDSKNICDICGDAKGSCSSTYKGIISALREYSSAAEKYFSKSFEGEAKTANMTDVPAYVKGGELPTGLKHYVVTLLLETETTIRHYFILDSGCNITDYTFYVDLDGGCDLDPYELLTPQLKQTEENGDRLYFVDIEGITPNELDVQFKLVVTGEGKEYSCAYSALNYAKNVYSNSPATQNLAANIYNYNQQAGSLRANVTYNANGGVFDTENGGVASEYYEYGVEMPVLNPVSKEGHEFLGWFDSNGYRVTEISPSQTGNITLTAKWHNTQIGTFYDLKTQEDSQGLYNICFYHLDENKDGKCDDADCGRCMYCTCTTAVDENADGVCDTCKYPITPCNAYSSTSEACAKCGKKKNDYALSSDATDYINKGTNYASLSIGYSLRNGKLIVRGANTNEKFSVGKSDYTVKQLVENGVTQITYLTDMRFWETGNDVKVIGWGLSAKESISHSYVNANWRVLDQYIIWSRAQNGKNGVHDYPTKNGTGNAYTGKTVKIVIDFSDVNLSQTGKQVINIKGYGGSTLVLNKNYSITITDTLSTAIAQNTGSGTRISGIHVFDGLTITDTSPAYHTIDYGVYEVPEGSAMTYTPGTPCDLPEIAYREGYIFAGWYEDEALTKPIKEVPANWTGEFTPYAKWSIDPDFFTVEMFGGTPAVMGSNYYVAPPVSVDELNEHPRLMVTADMLNDVKALLASEKYAALNESLFALANINNGDKIPNMYQYTYEDGKFPNKRTYAYDDYILAIIEAKAFAYLLTGNAQYAEDAILGIKNAMLTLNYPASVFWDEYRGASYTMKTAALVYDWCYSAMDEDDKNQIVAGVANFLAPQLEYSYPPINMSPLTGHGTGPQFLRDYLSCAIAFADEYPDWWTLIGGRFYQEFVPCSNLIYGGGHVPGGTEYGTEKLYNFYWSAWAMKTATGTMPYDEGVANSFTYYLAQYMPNGRMFQSGDGGAGKDGVNLSTTKLSYFAAALFPDGDMTDYMLSVTSGAKSFSYNVLGGTTPPVVAVLVAQAEKLGPANGDGKFVGLDMVSDISYIGSHITVRNSWGSNAAVVWMKMNELNAGNHEHADTGTFQIYYKGLLASNSGQYWNYGCTHWNYYLRATVSHNGFLVYDVDKFEKAIVKCEDCNITFTIDECDNVDKIVCESCGGTNTTVTNASKAYYSGGQKAFGEAYSYGTFTSGRYTVSENIGKQYKYGADGITPEYAYIASDLTQAYPTDTVDYAGRSMLTVYTGDEDYPMFFFVYDDVTSDKETSIKKFLYHTPYLPTVAEDGTVTVKSGSSSTNGKLILKTVYATDSENYYIESIGGDGKRYSVNGYNILDPYAKKDTGSDWFGRLELCTSGSRDTQMLNVMYVTDGDKEAGLAAESFDVDGFVGSKIGNVVAMFATERTRTNKQFSFTAPAGDGNVKFYIAGVESGTWNVTIGASTEAVTVSEEGGFMSFEAPAGSQVTVTPGEGVLPTTEGRIIYKNAGTLPANAPESFALAGGTSLAGVIPTDGSNKFLGWYTSPTDFSEENRVTEIPAQTDKAFVVYARWMYSFVHFDGTAPNNENEGFSSTNGLISGYDEATGKYTSKWYNPGNGGSVTSNFNTYHTYSSMPENAITIKLTLALDGTKSMPYSWVRLGDGKNLFMLQGKNIFLVSANVRIALSQTMTTHYFVVEYDEDTGKTTITYRDANGTVKYKWVENWKLSSCGNLGPINFRSQQLNSNTSVIIGGLEVTSGNWFEQKDLIQTNN